MEDAPEPGSVRSTPAAGEGGVLVAISGSDNSQQLVRAGEALARSLGTGWEAIHIETPGMPRQDAPGAVADALGLAARLGAAIATVPAASVADGIVAHLESSPARHLVLGVHPPRRWRQRWTPTLLERLASCDGLVLHVHPDRGERRPRPSLLGLARRPRAALLSYAYAALAVAATLLVSEVLQLFISTRPLDLLFLFPVIAVAARLGLGPAMFAAVLSVIAYNYFLLIPYFSFKPLLPQNLVMLAVLAAVGLYTSMLTTQMRNRLLLSDRSAHENASLAALAQRLTRDSDWEATARTVCEHVQSLLEVQTVMFREIGGKLRVAGAQPGDPRLGPIDHTALDWAWAQGTEAGAGTATLPAANWQFQPLKTSLGVLAVLGVARDDGRNPIRADRRTLLLTIVAQAALAHERLRLEDMMRDGGEGAR